MWRQTLDDGDAGISHTRRLSEHLGHLLHQPLVSPGVGRLGHARPRREHVVPPRRDRSGELLPRLAELALEPIADDGIADRLRNGKAEPRLAVRVVVTWKPVQGEVPRRHRAALSVDRIEVLRP